MVSTANNQAQALATQLISPSEEAVSQTLDTTRAVTNCCHQQLMTNPEPSTAVTHPDPFITQTGYEPERTLLQTYYLTALDPQNPVEPHIKLYLYLENCRRDTEMLIELTTNDDSISFICQVVASYFGDGYGITGCDRVS